MAARDAMALAHGAVVPGLTRRVAESARRGARAAPRGGRAVIPARAAWPRARKVRAASTSLRPGTTRPARHVTFEGSEVRCFQVPVEPWVHWAPVLRSRWPGRAPSRRAATLEAFGGIAGLRPDEAARREWNAQILAVEQAMRIEEEENGREEEIRRGAEEMKRKNEEMKGLMTRLMSTEKVIKTKQIKLFTGFVFP